MAENKSVIRLAEVLSVEYDDYKNDQGGLRIRVRLQEDTEKQYPRVSDLPYCYPLLPKHIHLNPKVGECVLIILASLNSPTSQRYFIGPLISQQYALNFDPYFFQSRCLLTGGNSAKPLPNPIMNAENNGSYPNEKDVALQGRNNADLILKENEVRLRCGFKRYPYTTAENNLLFNREDLSYIQMRYKGYKGKIYHGDDFNSCINIVADKINLLSHKSKNQFTLNDPNELIPFDEQIRIHKEAHPLPYGDELIEFLKKLIEVIRTHTHPMSMDPPCFTDPQNDVLKTVLDNFLSKSIRIN